MDQIDDYVPTATEALEKLRTGEMREDALVRQCIARIARFDVDAWVDPLATLKRSDREKAAYTPYPSELTGIPIGVKDIIDVAGWPTRGASTTTSDQPVERDAPVVARLRAAGAT